MTAWPAGLADTVPYLSDGTRPVLGVGDTWSAVSVPADWGQIVLDILGHRTGPAYYEAALGHFVWPLAPRAAEVWPDAEAAGVERFGAGDMLLVPGPQGYYDGSRWLHTPATGFLFTDPAVLRLAVEHVIGPLEEAAVLGPVAVCTSCGAPTRQGRPVEVFISLSGPGCTRYICPRCYTTTALGGTGRHLHAVGGPG